MSDFEVHLNNSIYVQLQSARGHRTLAVRKLGFSSGVLDDGTSSWRLLAAPGHCSADSPVSVQLSCAVYQWRSSFCLYCLNAYALPYI